VRRGARRALGLGAALLAIATVGATCAEVLPIDVDECSTACVSPTDEDEPASAGDITLSLFGGQGAGGRGGRGPDLILDPDTVPAIVVEGPLSPIVSLGAQAFDGPGVSPYAFFETIIDIPLSVDAKGGFADAALFLFAPGTIGRVTLTDFLSNGNELFKPPIIQIAPIQPAL
jgi:hypothetical protein